MNKKSLLILVLNIIYERRSSEVAITSNIISQFTEHHLVFHYENTTKQLVEAIVLTTKFNNTYLMNNYDLHSNQFNIMTRPNGYKFLHVIMLQNYNDFNRFTSTSIMSLKYVDLLLFLNMERSSFMLWEGNILEKAGGLFVLDTWNLFLYTVCFFCGELSNILRKIDGLSISDNNHIVTVPKLDGYINQFDNFNKHLFIVGYNIYKPFFFGDVVEQTGNYTPYDGKGVERELLVVLSEKLNFVCLIVPFSMHKSPWAAVVEAVSKNNLDFAISGITLTLPRSRIVDFTTGIRKEPFTILYSLYYDPWMSWKIILLPFQLYIWLTLAATVFLISSLLFFTIRRTNEDIHFIFFIQGWFRLLFEQPVFGIKHYMKSRWPIMFLMFLWFLFALIINNSYKSKLTSSLINSRAKEYNTIDEIVDKGYRFELNNFDSTVVQENLQLSLDPKFLEALQRSRNDTPYCTAIGKTVNHKIAMIDENTLMQNMVQEKCREQLTISEQDDMRLLRDDLFPSTHAWPMQFNSPYRVKFNRIISRLHSAGLFVKWATDYFPLSRSIPRSHQRVVRLQAPSFNLTTMLGPAIIWTVGICIATLVFIGEQIRRR